MAKNTVESNLAQMQMLMRWLELVPPTEAQQERLSGLTDQLIDRLEASLEEPVAPVQTEVARPVVHINPLNSNGPVLPGADRVADGNYPSVMYEVRRFERLSEIVNASVQPRIGRSLTFEEIRDGVQVLLESNEVANNQTPEMGTMLDLGALFASFEIEPELG